MIAIEITLIYNKLKNKSLLYSDYLLGAKYQTAVIPFLSRLKLLASDLFLRVQNFSINVLHKLLYKQPSILANRILIFRTGSLGDSICAIPAIRAITVTYPNAKIDILTNAGRKNLVGLHQLLQTNDYNEIIDYFEYPKKALFKLLRQRKYDMVVQLPQVDSSYIRIIRDMLTFRGIASAGFGWHVSQLPWFRRIQAQYLIFPNEIERLSWLLNRQGISSGPQNSILSPSVEKVNQVKFLLKKEGVPQDYELIAVILGAKRPQNRWPVGYFRMVIEHFSLFYRIILIGSEEDNVLVKSLLDINNVTNLCGKLTPMQSAAALSLCKLTIANDTGPMHLSYAVNTPTIALFSSRDLPGKWYPPENNYVFRTANIGCQACFSEICKNNICMQAISPQEVINCAEELLQKSKN